MKNRFLILLLFATGIFAQIKVSELPRVDSLVNDDLMLISRDSSNTLKSKSVHFSDLENNIGVDKNIIQVDKFGANIDSSNNSVYIQSGITYLNAQGGGTLVFGNGTYKIDSSIVLNGKSNITLRGSGNTVIKCPGIPVYHGSQRNPLNNGVLIANSSNITIENIKFEGQLFAVPYNESESREDNNGINIINYKGNVSNIKILNCQFDSLNNCVLVEGHEDYQDSLITNIEIDNCKMTNSFQGIYSRTLVYNFRYTRNYVYNTYGTGIAVNCVTNNMGNNAKNINGIVALNTCELNGSENIIAAGKSVIVSNNTCKISNVGIRVGGGGLTNNSDIQVIGNTVIGNDTSAFNRFYGTQIGEGYATDHSYYGICLNEGSNYIDVSHNVIKLYRYDGILTGGQHNTFSYNQIDLTKKQASNNGIYVTQFGGINPTENTFSFNKIKNANWGIVLGATNADISSYPSIKFSLNNFYHNTIDSCTNAVGLEKCIVDNTFDGNIISNGTYGFYYNPEGGTYTGLDSNYIKNNTFQSLTSVNYETGYLTNGKIHFNDNRYIGCADTNLTNIDHNTIKPDKILMGRPTNNITFNDCRNTFAKTVFSHDINIESATITESEAIHNWQAVFKGNNVGGVGTWDRAIYGEWKDYELDDTSGQGLTWFGIGKYCLATPSTKFRGSISGLELDIMASSPDTNTVKEFYGFSVYTGTFADSNITHNPADVCKQKVTGEIKSITSVLMAHSNEALAVGTAYWAGAQIVGDVTYLTGYKATMPRNTGTVSDYRAFYVEPDGGLACTVNKRYAFYSGDGTGVASFGDSVTVRGNLYVNDTLYGGKINLSGYRDSYILKISDVADTLIKIVRSDGTWDGYLTTNGWGNYGFTKSVGIGYNNLNTQLSSDPALYIKGNLQLNDTTQQSNARFYNKGFTWLDTTVYFGRQRLVNLYPQYNRRLVTDDTLSCAGILVGGNPLGISSIDHLQDSLNAKITITEGDARYIKTTFFNTPLTGNDFLVWDDSNLYIKSSGYDANDIPVFTQTAGSPAGGKDGDTHYDTATGKKYEKLNGSWENTWTHP